MRGARGGRGPFTSARAATKRVHATNGEDVGRRFAWFASGASWRGVSAQDLGWRTETPKKHRNPRVRDREGRGRAPATYLWVGPTACARFSAAFASWTRFDRARGAAGCAALKSANARRDSLIAAKQRKLQVKSLSSEEKENFVREAWGGSGTPSPSRIVLPTQRDPRASCLRRGMPHALVGKCPRGTCR